MSQYLSGEPPDITATPTNYHINILLNKEDNPMKVSCSKKNIYLIKDGGNRLAHATITIDDAFVVKGFSVLNSSNGIFVAMPQEKGNDGNYYDKAFPITADARKIIQQAVIEAYSARVKAREQAAEQDGEQFTASTPDESAEEQSTEDEEEMELA